MNRLEYFKAKTEATLSPMEYTGAKKANPEQYYLLDVRNAPAEVMKNKISGAAQIPLPQLKDRLNELPEDKIIVVYCWDVWCNMGAHAAVLLLENGFDVKELSGGIASWNALNLPTESV